MNFFLFILSIILLLIFAVGVAVRARVKHLPVFILILIILPWVELVSILELLDLFHLMGSIPVILITQLVLAVVAIFIAKPHALKPYFLFIKLDLKKLFAELNASPGLALWFISTAAFYTFNLIVTFVVPPNNNDALSTHIARVGFWLRHGGLSPWETDRWYQLIYPPNAQLVLYWQALFLRSDVLFGALQWISAIGAAIAVFAISREFKFTRQQSLYSALSFLAFPVVLFQSTTTQNDLVMAMAVLTAVYFLIRAYATRSYTYFLIATAVFSFGFGIKQTFLVYIPALALFLIVSFLKIRPNLKRRGWITVFAIAITLFVLIGANQYIRTTILIGNPFGPAQVLENQTNQQSTRELPAKVAINSLRAFYGYIDPAGLPDPLFGYFHKLRARVFDHIPGRSTLESPKYLAPEKVFNIDTVYPANEDTAQYGALFLLTLSLGLLVALKRALKKDVFALIILLSVPVGFFLLIFARPGWDEFQARYLIPLVGMTLPFLGSAFTRSKIFRWLYIALAMLSLFTCSLYNPAKPVLGDAARNLNIWTADRVTLMMLQNHNLLDSIRMVERHVPSDSAIGIFADEYYTFQYPLFGENFTRDVTVIVDERRLADEEWLGSRGLTYLLLRVDNAENFIRPPDTYFKLVAVDGWRLYVRVTE